MLDMLATAVVHFAIKADNVDEARTKAAAVLTDVVEPSDLVGEGHLGTVLSNGPGHYDASAVILFRSLGETEEDARAMADTRLTAEISSSTILTAGAIVFVVRD